MNNLVPLPVLLPLLGAGLALALNRRPRAQRVVSTLVMVAVVAVATTLLVSPTASGRSCSGSAPGRSRWASRWSPTGCRALMLVVSSVVTLLVLLFSMGAHEEERKRETPVSIFHPTLLVLSAGVSNAFLAGDLFNLFVGFEMLLFASYVLLTLGGTGERVRAGTTYVVVSLLSSTLFLIALAAVYAATGTVNLAQLALRLPDLPDDLSWCCSCCCSPSSPSRPPSSRCRPGCPTRTRPRPPPVTAVFAGLLTKVGVYAIIRTQTVLFPDSPLTGLLLWAALATMVVGILGAIAQSEIKRMLSFTLVSHIGYMIFGIGLASVSGYAGAIFYTAHHITIQTTLFLVTGLIETRGGSTSLNKLGGLAAASPVLGILFFVPAMNLAGIPPLSGFVGKVGLLEAGAETGGFLPYLLVAGSVPTSLLTLYAMAKVWNRAFWRPLSAEPDALELVVARTPGRRSAAQPIAGHGAGRWCATPVVVLLGSASPSSPDRCTAIRSAPPPTSSADRPTSAPSCPRGSDDRAAPDGTEPPLPAGRSSC